MKLLIFFKCSLLLAEFLVGKKKTRKSSSSTAPNNLEDDDTPCVHVVKEPVVSAPPLPSLPQAGPQMSDTGMLCHKYCKIPGIALRDYLL